VCIAVISDSSLSWLYCFSILLGRANELTRVVCERGSILDMKHPLRPILSCTILRVQPFVQVFRGTLGLHDVLTDLVCKQQPLECDGLAGMAHGGMLEAARRLLDELRADIQAALRDHPGFKLVLCGHSLGGGLATLVAALVGPRIEIPSTQAGAPSTFADVRAYSFAAPAVLSLVLARQASHVTSVVRSRLFECIDLYPHTARCGQSNSKD
jgi:hypothetical protein